MVTVLFKTIKQQNSENKIYFVKAIDYSATQYIFHVYGGLWGGFDEEFSIIMDFNSNPQHFINARITNTSITKGYIRLIQIKGIV